MSAPGALFQRTQLPPGLNPPRLSVSLSGLVGLFAAIAAGTKSPLQWDGYSCLPAVLPFSLSALGSLGVCRQSSGTPGPQILWRAVAGKAGRRGLEHLTTPLFCTQQVRCIRNLKGEQRWRPGGGGGLGEAGAGERPLQRLWCCPSPTGCRTEPDKRQTGFRRAPRVGPRTRCPHNSSWSSTPSGALGCRA